LLHKLYRAQQLQGKLLLVFVALLVKQVQYSLTLEQRGSGEGEEVCLVVWRQVGLHLWIAHTTHNIQPHPPTRSWPHPLTLHPAPWCTATSDPLALIHTNQHKHSTNQTH